MSFGNIYLPIEMLAGSPPKASCGLLNRCFCVGLSRRFSSALGSGHARLEEKQKQRGI